MKAGRATWAPVSPPAAVVLANSSDGCSWLMATTVTPTTVSRVAQAGQLDRPTHRHRRGGPAAGGSAVVSGSTGAGVTRETSTGVAISDAHGAHEGEGRHHRGHHGEKVETGVGHHVHPEPPGAVGDATQDDPERGQPEQLEPFV